jgi:F-box and leucine-rich repeat protein 1 (S-phase kinase-associated protein 2)
LVNSSPQIFRWLPKSVLAKCARVSRRFHRLMLDDSFWRRMDLGTKSLPQGVVGQLMARGIQTLRLAKANLASPVLTTATGFEYGKDTCKLTCLDLSMAAVEVDELEKMLRACKRLQRLSLENMRLSRGCLEALSEARPLATLNLTMCRGITATGMRALLTKCQNLRDLNLAWTNLSVSVLDEFADHVTDRGAIHQFSRIILDSDSKRDS